MDVMHGALYVQHAGTGRGGETHTEHVFASRNGHQAEGFVRRVDRADIHDLHLAILTDCRVVPVCGRDLVRVGELLGARLRSYGGGRQPPSRMVSSGMI